MDTQAGLGRANGRVLDAAHLGRAVHLCWPYEDRTQLHATAAQYVRTGLRLGERVLCIVEDADADVLAGLDAALDAPTGTTTGPALQFMSANEAERQMSPGGPRDRLAFYDAAVQQAKADGYRGLRALADATALMADPDARSQHISWEHLADEYMAGTHGLSAMCAYRSDVLGADAVADVACVHPLVREQPTSTGFRLFFEADRLALAGSVDSFNAQRLSRTLERSHVQRAPLTLDLGRLEFIDVEGTMAIADWGRRLTELGIGLRLIGVPASMQKIWAILDLPHDTTLTLQALA